MDLVTAALILLPTQAIGWFLYWALGLHKSGSLSHAGWAAAIVAVSLILAVPLLIMLALAFL